MSERRRSISNKRKKHDPTRKMLRETPPKKLFPTTNGQSRERRKCLCLSTSISDNIQSPIWPGTLKSFLNIIVPWSDGFNTPYISFLAHVVHFNDTSKSFLNFICLRSIVRSGVKGKGRALSCQENHPISVAGGCGPYMEDNDSSHIRILFRKADIAPFIRYCHILARSHQSNPKA